MATHSVSCKKNSFMSDNLLMISYANKRADDSKRITQNLSMQTEWRTCNATSLSSLDSPASEPARESACDQSGCMIFYVTARGCVCARILNVGVHFCTLPTHALWWPAYKKRFSAHPAQLGVSWLYLYSQTQKLYLTGQPCGLRQCCFSAF